MEQFYGIVPYEFNQNELPILAGGGTRKALRENSEIAIAKFDTSTTSPNACHWGIILRQAQDDLE
jgi:hypothetical protein